MNTLTIQLSLERYTPYTERLELMCRGFFYDIREQENISIMLGLTPFLIKNFLGSLFYGYSDG